MLNGVGTEIKCKNCSEALAKFAEVPKSVVWYSRLRHKLGGACPECGHKLPRVSSYVQKMQFAVESKMPVVAK